MTLDVYRGRKTTIQQQQQLLKSKVFNWEKFTENIKPSIIYKCQEAKEQVVALFLFLSIFHLVLETKLSECANSEALDEVAHHEPPHPNLHCLPSSLWILNMI